MSKLTGAALDYKVAHATGLKSVNNCEQWGTSMTEDEQKEVQKARDMLDAQPVPELSPESLYNIMEAMGFAQRPWAGLTTNELLECAKDFDGKLPKGWAKIVYLAQDILKEKNT